MTRNGFRYMDGDRTAHGIGLVTLVASRAARHGR